VLTERRRGPSLRQCADSLAEVPAARTLIDDDLRAFILGPVSAFLGTADSLGTPDVTRVCGLVALDDHRMRILIGSEASTARSNATVGAHVAVIVTDITNYRSVQWKGSVVTPVEPRTSGDLVVADRHVEGFVEASPIVGLDPAIAADIFPADVVALVVELTEAFDQTPGPGAGLPLGGLA